jgi:outer membrane immunogenic protein
MIATGSSLRDPEAERADFIANPRGVADQLQRSKQTGCILPPSSSRRGGVMRKFLLGTAALIALVSPAISADMRAPVYKAPPPVWSWTGCYAGGHAGGLWAKAEEWIVRTPGGAFYGESLGGHEADSWVGGVQAGCDYQFAGGFVIGIQGDYAGTDAEGSHDSAREFGVAYHSKIKSLATVTGRMGYAWDRFLGYVRGGGAWERDNYWATTIVLGTAYTARETRSGLAIGVGGEYALTNFLSGFVEYNYYDLGTHQVGFTPQISGLGSAFVDIKETKSVVRAGLNLRLGGYAAPIVVKY